MRLQTAHVNYLAFTSWAADFNKLLVQKFLEHDVKAISLHNQLRQHVLIEKREQFAEGHIVQLCQLLQELQLWLIDYNVFVNGLATSEGMDVVGDRIMGALFIHGAVQQPLSNLLREILALVNLWLDTFQPQLQQLYPRSVFLLLILCWRTFGLFAIVTRMRRLG